MKTPRKVMEKISLPLMFVTFVMAVLVFAVSPVSAAPPPAEFPFAGLEGVAVTILWCPYPQKQAWLPVVREQGLAESFQIYTNSESGTITLKEPPKPKLKLTEGEREVQRARILTGLQTLLRCIGLALLAILILPPIAWLWGRWRGPRPPRRPGPPPATPARHR